MLNFIKQHYAILALLTAYTFLSHALLLINDLPYWDGWYYFFSVQRGEKDRVMQEWSDNGRPLIGAVFWFLASHLGTLAGFRFAEVLCILVTAFTFYALLTRHTRLTAGERLCAALLTCSCASYQVHLAVTTFPFVAAMPFFMLGLLMLAECDQAAGTRRLALRCGAHLGLLAGYVSEAYVITGLALPLLLWCLHGMQQGLRAIPRYYRRYADFALAAAAYIAAMIWLMPVQGSYAHSRAMDLSPLSLIKYFTTYLASAADIPNMVNLLPRKLHSDASLAVLGVLAAAGIYRYVRRKPGADSRYRLYCMGVALLLLGSISAPFVVSQRVTATAGWEMRHLVPAGFAAALILTCAVGYFTSREKWRRILLVALPVLSLLAITRDYVGWQARGAFDHGVIENLRGQQFMARPIIFFVGWKDFFYKQAYRSYEWEHMMEAATGSKDHWVIMANPPLTLPLWQEQYRMHIKPGDTTLVTMESCQMGFNPVPSPESVQWRSGVEYLWRKYTGSVNDLALWVSQRVSLEITMMKNCE